MMVMLGITTNISINKRRSMRGVRRIQFRRIKTIRLNKQKIRFMSFSAPLTSFVVIKLARHIKLMPLCVLITLVVTFSAPGKCAG